MCRQAQTEYLIEHLYLITWSRAMTKGCPNSGNKRSPTTLILFKGAWLPVFIRSFESLYNDHRITATWTRHHTVGTPHAMAQAVFRWTLSGDTSVYSSMSGSNLRVCPPIAPAAHRLSCIEPGDYALASEKYSTGPSRHRRSSPATEEVLMQCIDAYLHQGGCPQLLLTTRQ